MRTCQVWSLTLFFLFLFSEKIIDLPGGQIDDPTLGKYFFLTFLPATPSTLPWTLDSPCALLPELQRNKDTVSCATLNAGSHDTVKNS